MALEIELGDINYLAVLVAIVINMLAGALWYSPLLFAKPWMALNNFTEETIREQGSATKGYIVSIIASIVIAFAIALIAEAADVDDPAGGALLGLVVGLGFVATTSASSYIFESRSLKHYLINAGYPVASFVLMGLVIGAWQ